MTTSRYTDEFLDSMREVMDPPADMVVSEMSRTGRVDAVNHLMRNLVKNDTFDPAGLPASVADYFRRQAVLPAWADFERVRRAEDFFARHGLCATMILACASLPECYAAAKGVNVLHMTARLATDPTRRIAETGQMVLHVMEPGGLSPEGQGLRIAQKVRLMHAAIRQLIRASGQWDNAWGQPVNQEDLAGTLMTFSWTTIDAFGRLGVTVSPEDADAYIHAWNVVGSVLGVRDELLPANVAEAQELNAAVRRRQFVSSPAGREMAQALVQFLQRHMPTFHHLPEAFMRHFLGDEMGDMLGLAPTSHDGVAECCELVLGLVEKEVDHSDRLAAISRPFSRAILETFSVLERGGRAPFDVPTRLRDSWGLT